MSFGIIRCGEQRHVYVLWLDFLQKITLTLELENAPYFQFL